MNKFCWLKFSPASVFRGGGAQDTTSQSKSKTGERAQLVCRKAITPMSSGSLETCASRTSTTFERTSFSTGASHFSSNRP